MQPLFSCNIQTLYFIPFLLQLTKSLIGKNITTQNLTKWTYLYLFIQYTYLFLMYLFIQK